MGAESPLYEVPRLVASGRLQQMLETVNFDAKDPNCGAPLAQIKETNGSIGPGTLIFQLLQENQDLFDKFLNNRFCKGMALGQLTESAYLEFAKQDYLYLLDNVRFRALRFAKLDSRTPFTELQAQSQKIASAVEYTQSWKKTCVSDLGIPAAAMDSIEPSAAEIGYASFLKSQTMVDDLLSLYVITIPCIYGWGQIAERLANDPTTDKTTLFYKTWVAPNLGPQSGQKLSQFIEANRAFYASLANMGVWTQLFRTALKFEIALFDSVLAAI